MRNTARFGMITGISTVLFGADLLDVVRALGAGAFAGGLEDPDKADKAWGLCRCICCRRG